MYRSFLKRLFDFLIATVAFGIALPIFIVIMVWLFFVNRGKPFFLQERPGKGEGLFKVIKLKTMTDEEDEKGEL